MLVGVFVGIAGLFAFDTTMKITSTDEFCVSCHEMQTALTTLKTTNHFANRSGVVAGCGDCHIPHATVPKILRKIEAAREVYGHFTGIIDTPEKYAAHRASMQEHEIQRMKASDSAECRYCHSQRGMDEEKQSKIAIKRHAEMLNGKTCIDCHTGIAHSEEADSDENFDL